MNKQFLRVATRLAVLCSLLATFALIGVAPATHSATWSDYDYFNAVYACDGNYFGTLVDCRSNPGYPDSPTEGLCRYNAGSSFVDCLGGIPSAPVEPDFCDGARAARDNCINQYGPESGNTDLGAMMECRSASGIDQCE